jgi:hypothetical protein
MLEEIDPKMVATVVWRNRAQKPSRLLRPCLVDWFEVIWDELRFLLRILILADVAADIDVYVVLVCLNIQVTQLVDPPLLPPPPAALPIDDVSWRGCTYGTGLRGPEYSEYLQVMSFS